MRVVPRVVHAREAWPSGEVLRSRLPPARVRKTAVERLTQDQASAALAKDLAATKGLDERKLRRRIAQLEQELELERQFNHAARDER